MKKLASLILVLVVILTMIPTAFAEEAPKKIAIICDPVGNNLFLTQVVDEAKKMESEYNIEVTTIECGDTDEWQFNYEAASYEDYDLILGVGWQSAEYASNMADQFGDVKKYAVIDTDAGNEKVMSIMYNEQQAAYLMGVMAAAAFPEQEMFGYIGCFDGAGSFKYRWGFAEGVKSITPNAKFMFNFTNSYSDTAIAYDYAKQQQKAGATYIFGGAAACNEGIFTAALELAQANTPIYSIAQDADATKESNPYILSSQLKNTGVSTRYVIEAFLNDTMTMGLTEQALVDGAIGATHVTNPGAYLNSEILTEDVINTCKAAVEKIVNGELVLTVPADMDSYVFDGE